MRDLLAVALAFMALPAAAGSLRSATMNVSTRVVAGAVLEIEEQPATVVVTTADIARGYVDVSEPLVVRVRANDPAGYLFQAAKADPAFSAVELSMSGAVMTVRGEGAWLRRPYSRVADVMTIRARLYLAEGTDVGVRPLPVRFRATSY